MVRRGWPCKRKLSDKTATEKTVVASDSAGASIVSAGSQGNQMDHMDGGPTGEGSSVHVSKRGRGPTRCLDLLRLPKGQKLPIIWNATGQPVGENSSMFQNFCGTLARDGYLIPVNVHSWREIEEICKERAWQAILGKFDIAPTMRQFAMKSLSKKWRDHKSELKRKVYNACSSDVERYANRPDSVIESQWFSLIQFWNSPEGQKRSRTNKLNRAKQAFVHTSGTKSFARVSYEEQVKSGSDIPPGRAKVFKKTHIRKGGAPVNDVAAEKIRHMQDLMSQAPEGSHDSTSRSDVYSQVMGPERRGRVRGCGLGPTPTSMWGPSSSYTGTSNLEPELQSLREEVKSLREDATRRDVELLELRNMFHSFVSRQGSSNNNDTHQQPS